MGGSLYKSMEEVTGIYELLSLAEEKKLYRDLIRQLNKDFKFANLEADYEEDIHPVTLKQLLHETVFNLINQRFADYLNLLYIIDVSEAKVKELDGSDILKLSEAVVLLILKREWQKVWFRYKYQ
ncbi:hypothetical protein [Robertkochia solimangrovi]|uniref:hypothetical protein n=1 Tax=Robertkochia solimangrovi TaxID=2213046 RepID=UPI001F54F5B4|nr:hypothetical protein [Robertkochia solimangrovi]